MIRTTFVMCLALTSGAHAQSWTVTGPQGGSGGGSVACTTDAGSRSCETVRSYTTANGRTFEASRSRFADANGATVTRNVSRPSGASLNMTRSRNR
ncbi:MAG: hypothetical protein AAFO97_13535 [Pseudomonadota bacterium]